MLWRIAARWWLAARWWIVARWRIVARWWIVTRWWIIARRRIIAWGWIVARWGIVARRRIITRRWILVSLMLVAIAVFNWRRPLNSLRPGESISVRTISCRRRRHWNANRRRLPLTGVRALVPTGSRNGIAVCYRMISCGGISIRIMSAIAARIRIARTSRSGYCSGGLSSNRTSTARWIGRIGLRIAALKNSGAT